MGTTLTAMQAGGGVGLQFVVAIEGYSYLITNGSTSAAVTAWSGSDWSSALGGLVIEWGEGQRARPWDPEINVSNLRIGIQPDASETFATVAFNVKGGTETRLITALDCDDTTVAAQRTDSFAASGEIHIQGECMAYSSRDTSGDTFTVSTRGLYSPFTVNGGGRMAHPHILGTFENLITLKPQITSSIRQWVGRWVAIYAHRVVAGVLDVKAQAQLLFAGRIANDPQEDERGWCWLDCEDVRATVRDTVLMRDQFTATVQDGMFFARGWTFSYRDRTGSTIKDANDLIVVGSGASGANEMDEGVYSYDEFIARVNQWLSAENSATRINFRVTLRVAQTDEGIRTEFVWSHGSTADGMAVLSGPGDALRFLGWTEFNHHGALQFELDFNGSDEITARSQDAPYRRYVSVAATQEQGYGWIPTTEETGTFFDNQPWFPSELGLPTGSAGTFGVVQMSTGGWWLVKRSVAGKLHYHANSYASHFLADLAGSSPEFNATFNMRDDGTGGVTTIRQVALLNASFRNLVMYFLASTGTAGFNHATYDALPTQLSAGIPWSAMSSLAGDITAQQSASADLMCVIEKPTRLWDVLGCEFVMRGAFLVWGGGGSGGSLRCRTWATPSATTAVHSLTEANKADPAQSRSTHRTVAHADDSTVVNLVKINYNRSLASGESYRQSITIADVSAMESTGSKTITVNARNCYGANHSSTAAVETLATFVAGWLPLFVHPMRLFRRSIALPLFEGVAPGDHCTITDNNIRDPSTGARGVSGLPGLIVSHRVSWGGLGVGDGGPGIARPLVGEVDVLVFPRSRIAPYAPCAQVDDTAGGAGYNAGTKVLTLYAHQHSESSGTADAAEFLIGDDVLIVEIDPADPAAPQSWTDEVAAQSGNTITLTTGLAGFDTAKKYRVVSNTYGTASTTQRADCYQADSTDGLIEDTLQPYHYGYQAYNPSSWTDDTTTSQVELYADLSYGDGRPFDTGYERAECRLVNNLVGYRTAPSFQHMTYSVSAAGGSFVRGILWILPLSLGPGELGAGNRLLYLRPFFRSGTGASATVRVSLCRHAPIGSSRTLTDEEYPEYVLVGPTESNDWTTSSTTWAAGTAYGFSMKVLSDWGEGYVVIEKTPDAECRGIAEGRAGPFAEDA